MRKVFFCLVLMVVFFLAGCAGEQASTVSPVDTAAAFNDLTADGSSTATTTKLTLTLDQDIAGLAVGDITLSAGTTGATKGALNKTGTGIYELAVNGISAAGQIAVSISKEGFIFNPASRNIDVFYYKPIVEEPDTEIAFSNLTADGSATATTAKLTLTFNQNIADLAAADITLTPGTTGAVKGALTKATGTGVYDLAVSGITASGQVTVSVSKEGFTFTPTNRNVNVSYYVPSTGEPFTITFGSIEDGAPVIEGPTISLSGSNGPKTATVSLSNPEQYSSIKWNLYGITGNGASFALNSANTVYNSIGEHKLTFVVEKNGIPYSRTITFKVVS